MMSQIDHHSENNSLAAAIEKEVDVKVRKCYQCGKCTAGCPVAFEMDYTPSTLMRMLQTENPLNDDKVLRSNSIWLCLTCEMCISRCPMEVDIPVIMDNLRQRSLKQKKENHLAKNTIAFHKSFLRSIKFTGRLFELGLILDYKRQSLNMTQDITLAPKMIARGKLHFIPKRIKGMDQVAGIFNKITK
ncbi:MAG: 4Fe-4S dicluster domain-containing protein [Omnitrophica WOR_2 bacterium]